MRKAVIFFATLALLMAISTSPVHAQVQLPHAFYGSVLIDGAPAEDGTLISATVDAGTVKTNPQNPVATVDGSYGVNSLKLLVQGDIPEGATIRFYVNGVEAEGVTATFQSGGGPDMANLSVAAAPEVTHELTMAVVGEGTVTPDSGTYAEGDMTITATATSGWKFSSWSTTDMGEIANASSAATTLTLDKDKTVTATFTEVTGPPSYGPTYYYIQTNLFGIEARYRIESDGELLQTIEATSADGNLTVNIPEGTVALDKDGERLETLEVTINETPPDPPEDAYIIELAYGFTPDGATFDPPITLTWSYDPDLPEDVAEEDLIVAYYDEDAGKWVEVDSVVDTENNSITASVPHFTTLAIIGVVPVVTPPAPAAFSVSSLSVLPAEVEPGETVTISVLVANTGGESGSYSVVLKINGVKEQEKLVTITAGRSRSVSFSVTREEAGSYTVAVDGSSDSFTVVPVVVPPEPAAFSVSSLSVEPAEVSVGEEVRIDVAVTNTGGTEGSYTVVLKINGVKEADRTVTVAAGDTLNLIFPVTREEAGIYTITVDGLSGSFTVVAPEEEEEVPTKINWPLIGGIIGGVIVVGLGVFFWWMRRRAD